MKLNTPLFLVAALFLLAIPSLGYSDWAGIETPGLVRLQPANGSVVKQNPPGFSWVRASGASAYELSVRGPDGKTAVWQAPRNWYLPTKKLPLGNYFWKVRSRTPLGPWSTERSFSVDGTASVFVVPSEQQLISFIRSKPSPRALGQPNEDLASWISRTRQEKLPAIQSLENEVKTYATKPLVNEFAVALAQRSINEKAWVASITAIRQRSLAEGRQLRSAALLWRLTENPFYLEEAIRRGNALAELDWKGSTSHLSQDQGNRNIAWALALAHDYLASDIPGESSVKWLSSIENRTGEIFKDLKSGGWRLEQLPFDSHGGSNIGYLSAISAIMIDRIPVAEQWFNDAFRSYVHYQSPWGDEEGGYANGSAYAEYSAWAFIDFWDAIAAATKVNMYEKPWSRGLLRSLACFVPPGSPTHAFGDAAETRPESSIIKAFANRFSDPFSIWYGHNLVGNEEPFTNLTNPFPESPKSLLQAPQENACVFQHIGWAAMHSDWAERGRTSVYFKSSPYGSFNHSHADQNSFTVVAAGRPLLIDSGVYDWYGSAHWNNWYRQTVAHNAITFDGGKGQVTEGYEATLKAQGKLTRFEPGPDIDFVEGDATKAYGGALNKAIRKLWYIRSEQSIVVVDDLSSDSPRKYEWNAHAVSSFMKIASNVFKTQNMEQSACIDILSPKGLVSDIAKVSPPAVGTASLPKQTSHLRFAMPVAVPATRFVAVVRIGCKAPISTLSGTKVIVGNTSVESLK